MLESIALGESTICGGILVLLVFGMLRYIDEIVKVLASLEDSVVPEVPDDSDSSQS